MELSSSFLMMPWTWPEEGTTNADAEASEADGDANGPTVDVNATSLWASLVALVGSFASRVVDKAPTVRARAMVCLSEMLIAVHEGSAPQGTCVRVRAVVTRVRLNMQAAHHTSVKKGGGRGVGVSQTYAYLSSSFTHTSSCQANLLVPTTRMCVCVCVCRAA